MRGKVRIFGMALPASALALALILATAGAAVGVVLAGRVTGTIGSTVSQALIVLDNAGTFVDGPAADAALFTVKDDGTAFHATAEVNTGDEFTVNLALANNSGAQLVGELTLVAPDGITLLVRRVGGGDIPGAPPVANNVVRTGPFTWKFRLDPSSNATTDMRITVALADDMPPGFYAIDGTIKQVAV